MLHWVKHQVSSSWSNSICCSVYPPLKSLASVKVTDVPDVGWVDYSNCFQFLRGLVCLEEFWLPLWIPGLNNCQLSHTEEWLLQLLAQCPGSFWPWEKKHGNPYFVVLYMASIHLMVLPYLTSHCCCWGVWRTKRNDYSMGTSSVIWLLHSFLTAFEILARRFLSFL